MLRMVGDGAGGTGGPAICRRSSASAAAPTTGPTTSCCHPTGRVRLRPGAHRRGGHHRPGRRRRLGARRHRPHRHAGPDGRRGPSGLSQTTRFASELAADGAGRGRRRRAGGLMTWPGVVRRSSTSTTRSRTRLARRRRRRGDHDRPPLARPGAHRFQLRPGGGLRTAAVPPSQLADALIGPGGSDHRRRSGPPTTPSAPAAPTAMLILPIETTFERMRFSTEQVLAEVFGPTVVQRDTDGHYRLSHDILVRPPGRRRTGEDPGVQVARRRRAQRRAPVRAQRPQRPARLRPSFWMNDQVPSSATMAGTTEAELQAAHERVLTISRAARCWPQAWRHPPRHTGVPVPATGTTTHRRGRRAGRRHAHPDLRRRRLAVSGTVGAHVGQPDGDVAPDENQAARPELIARSTPPAPATIARWALVDTEHLRSAWWSGTPTATRSSHRPTVLPEAIRDRP